MTTERHIEAAQAHLAERAAGFPSLTPSAVTTLPHMMSADTRKELRQAGKQVKVWTAKRDELIRAAVDAGGSLREVGEAVGLSHTAVKFIAHGRGRTA